MKTEFEFINKIKNRYNLSKIGDDAAVLPKNNKTDLVISADMLVEDIDFRLDWSKAEFIGHKSLAVSISDIAAMGAKPVWAMISIGIPKKIWKTNFIDEFYEGFFRLAEKYEVEIIGGDVSKTPDKIVIDSIVLGEVKKGKAILRSNAKVGDLIGITGTLGGASAGLKLLKNGICYNNLTPSWQKNLLLKQLHPMPQNGKIFSKFATSMIDISDGLSSDLMHLCEASKVGAKIYADKIPIHKKIEKLLDNNYKKFLSEKMDKLDFALHGGEDFELLFTIKPQDFEKFSKKNSGKFSYIGDVTENVGKIELIQDGRSDILIPKGYSHF